MLNQYLQLPRTVHVLCLGTLVNRAGSMLLPFMTLYLSEKLNLGVPFATTTIGAFGLGSVLANLTGGYLADHIGRKPVMLVSMAGASAVLMVFGTLTRPEVILPAVILFAFVAEMYRPAASAMIADVVDPQQRPQAFTLMYLSVNLGFAIAPVVGGAMAGYSFHLLFLTDACTCLAYAGIVLFGVAETRPVTATTQSASGSGAKVDAHSGSALASMLRNPPFLLMCLGSLLIAVVYLQSFSTLPLYMQSLGMGPNVFGSVIAVNGVMIVCCQIHATALITRLDRGRVLAGSALLTALGFAYTALAATPWEFRVAIMIWTAGEIMQAPLWNTIVTDLAPTAFRARYLGVFSMTFATGHVVGAPVGGWMLQQWGGTTVWLSCAGAALAASMVFAFIARSVRVRAAAPADGAGEVAPGPAEARAEPASVAASSE